MHDKNKLYLASIDFVDSGGKSSSGHYGFETEAALGAAVKEFHVWKDGILAFWEKELAARGAASPSHDSGRSLSLTVHTKKPGGKPHYDCPREKFHDVSDALARDASDGFAALEAKWVGKKIA